MTGDEADAVAAEAAALNVVATVRVIEVVKPDHGTDDFTVFISTVFPGQPSSVTISNVGQWAEIKGGLS